MSLMFLLGGARSGKSSLAVRLATALDRPVTFIATGEARDHEMAERIRVHRAARAPSWSTLEEPLDLSRAIARARDDVVVLDCLSLWVSNAFETRVPAGDILERAGDAAAALSQRPERSFVVSNEVGLGIVPMHPLGRAYRDVLGSVNAVFARDAERAFFVVAGRALSLLDAAEVLEPW